MCLSEWIQSGENFVYLMYFTRNGPLLSRIIADSPKLPLGWAQFRKYIHTPPQTQRTCIHKYLHPPIYIYVQCMYHHTHACGTLKSTFKQTYPRGHNIHVLTETNWLFIYCIHRDTCVENMFVDRKDQRLSHTGIRSHFVFENYGYSLYSKA